MGGSLFNIRAFDDYLMNYHIKPNMIYLPQLGAEDYTDIINNYKKRENKNMGYKVISKEGSQLTVRLDSGAEVSGTMTQVSKTLQSLGYAIAGLGKTYKSESDGEVLIATMATPHIRNAMAKQLREYADSLTRLTDKTFSRSLYEKLDLAFWSDEFNLLWDELDERNRATK